MPARSFAGCFFLTESQTVSFALESVRSPALAKLRDLISCISFLPLRLPRSASLSYTCQTPVFPLSFSPSLPSHFPRLYLFISTPQCFYPFPPQKNSKSINGVLLLHWGHVPMATVLRRQPQQKSVDIGCLSKLKIIQNIQESPTWTILMHESNKTFKTSIAFSHFLSHWFSNCGMRTTCGTWYKNLFSHSLISLFLFSSSLSLFNLSLSLALSVSLLHNPHLFALCFVTRSGPSTPAWICLIPAGTKPSRTPPPSSLEAGPARVLLRWGDHTICLGKGRLSKALKYPNRGGRE